MKKPINRQSPWITLLQKPETGLALLRMYLGGALLVRGVIFVSRPQTMLAIIESSGDWFLPMAAFHAVAIAHLGGGLMLLLGLVTRAAAAIQVPVLLGAVLFHFGGGLLQVGQSLELSLLVLAMLITFSFYGGGDVSLDAFLRRDRYGKGHVDGMLQGPKERYVSAARNG